MPSSSASDVGEGCNVPALELLLDALEVFHEEIFPRELVVVLEMVDSLMVLERREGVEMLADPAHICPVEIPLKLALGLHPVALARHHIQHRVAQRRPEAHDSSGSHRHTSFVQHTTDQHRQTALRRYASYLRSRFSDRSNTPPPPLQYFSIFASEICPSDPFQSHHFRVVHLSSEKTLERFVVFRKCVEEERSILEAISCKGSHISSNPTLVFFNGKSDVIHTDAHTLAAKPKGDVDTLRTRRTKEPHTRINKIVELFVATKCVIVERTSSLSAILQVDIFLLLGLFFHSFLLSIDKRRERVNSRIRSLSKRANDLLKLFERVEM